MKGFSFVSINITTHMKNIINIIKLYDLDEKVIAK